MCVHLCRLLFRSGTEEEYTELEQLLEDIQTYLKDFTATKTEELKSAAQKRASDKRKGEEMSKAATEGISSTNVVAVAI